MKVKCVIYDLSIVSDKYFYSFLDVPARADLIVGHNLFSRNDFDETYSIGTFCENNIQICSTVSNINYNKQTYYIKYTVKRLYLLIYSILKTSNTFFISLFVDVFRFEKV